jgi:glutamate racemase
MNTKNDTIRNKPIGIFDSGVGGLTVMHEILKLLPNEDIIYYADTAHTPYGNKSKECISCFADKIINFLISCDIKLLVVACNTVSANYHDIMIQKFQIPIVEVITSGIDVAVRESYNKIIGIIGTESTISSHMYQRNILMINNKAKLFTCMCPLLVPLAEEGWINNKAAYDVIKIYLQKFITCNRIEALILACTHYPLFIDVIKKTFDNIKIIDPALRTAYTVKTKLDTNNLRCYHNKTQNRKIIFYASDNIKKFKSVTKHILHNDIKKIFSNTTIIYKKSPVL